MSAISGYAGINTTLKLCSAIPVKVAQLEKIEFLGQPYWFLPFLYLSMVQVFFKCNKNFFPYVSSGTELCKHNLKLGVLCYAGLVMTKKEAALAAFMYFTNSHIT